MRKCRFKVCVLLVVTLVALFFLFFGDVNEDRRNVKKRKLTSQEYGKNNDLRLSDNVDENWWLEAINWKKDLLSYCKNDVRIAIIDSGINHEKCSMPLNLTKNIDMKDRDHHGDIIAKIIHKVYSDAIIIPIKVYGKSDKPNNERMVKAINYAIDNNADVINISLSIRESNPKVERVMEKAKKRGIYIVCASANNKGVEGFPSCSINTISCSARNINNIDVGFADMNEAKKKTFAAPGVDIYINSQCYAGNSYATAIISAAIGIIKSIKPDITYREMNKLLEDKAVGESNKSYGIIDLRALVEAVISEDNMP